MKNQNKKLQTFGVESVDILPSILFSTWIINKVINIIHSENIVM